MNNYIEVGNGNFEAGDICFRVEFPDENMVREWLIEKKILSDEEIKDLLQKYNDFHYVKEIITCSMMKEMFNKHVPGYTGKLLTNGEGGVVFNLPEHFKGNVNE